MQRIIDTSFKSFSQWASSNNSSAIKALVVFFIHCELSTMADLSKTKHLQKDLLRHYKAHREMVEKNKSFKPCHIHVLWIHNAVMTIALRVDTNNALMADYTIMMWLCIFGTVVMIDHGMNHFALFALWCTALCFTLFVFFPSIVHFWHSCHEAWIILHCWRFDARHCTHSSHCL